MDCIGRIGDATERSGDRESTFGVCFHFSTSPVLLRSNVFHPFHDFSVERLLNG